MRYALSKIALATLLATGVSGCATVIHYQKKDATRHETLRTREDCRHAAEVARLKALEKRYVTPSDARTASVVAARAAFDACARGHGYKRVN